MTLTVTAATVLGDVPTVQVDVSSSPAVTDALTVYRVHDDGSRYKVLAEDQQRIIGESWTGFDFHCPFNQAVTYVAQTATQVSAASAEVWVISDDTSWLIHPSDPDLSVMVDMITEVSDFQYKDRSVSFQVLGRKLPIILTDSPRGGETGTITVLCETQDSRDALKALFADGWVILVNTPFTGDSIGWKWIQPGDLTIKNPSDRAHFGPRTATFSYTETSQPDVSSSVWNLGDLKAQAVTSYPTLGDLKTAYAGLTLKDLKLRVH